MKIERRSPLTGEINIMDLPITAEQLREWHSGGLIQRVFPHLTADQREFLKTGAYPGEWEAMCARLGLLE